MKNPYLLHFEASTVFAAVRILLSTARSMEKDPSYLLLDYEARQRLNYELKEHTPEKPDRFLGLDIVEVEGVHQTPFIGLGYK